MTGLSPSGYAYISSMWHETCSSHSPASMVAVAVYGAALVVYWVVGLAMLALDLTRSPRTLYRYRIQPKGFPTHMLRRLLTVVTLQWLLVIPLASTSLYWLLVQGLGWSGFDFSCTLPDPLQAVTHLLLFSVFEEIGFYYLHRAAHHKWLYGRFHKLHHEFTAPTALANVYCHPVEMVFVNIAPVLLPPVFLGSHILVVSLWSLIAVVGSQVHHQGYSFPWSSDMVEFHDLHHEKFNVNFGLLSLLDRLHGTYEEHWMRTPTPSKSRQH